MPSAMLVSGEAVTLELRPARLATRLLATVIDLLVVYTGAVLLLLFVNAAASAAGLDGAVRAAIGVLAYVGALLGYAVAMQVFNRGRTLGKIALGLRTVRDDGGPLSFRAALTRELVGLVVEKPGPLLGAPAVICALIREDGKRIGDVAAGTIVISERVAKVGPAVTAPYLPPELARWAAGLDLSRLPDDVALRGREVLGRAGTLRSYAREDLGTALVASFERAVGPPPPGTPGWAYLSAVLAERRRRDVERLMRPRAGSGAGPAAGAAPVAQALGTRGGSESGWGLGPGGGSGSGWGLGPGWGLPPTPGPGRELGTAAYDGEYAPPTSTAVAP